MISVINLSHAEIGRPWFKDYLDVQKKIGRSPLCRPGHRGRVRLLRTGLCNKPARYALSCGIKCDTQLGEQAHVRSEYSRHNDWVHRWKYLASRLHNQPLIYPSGIRSGSKNRSASPAKKVSWRTARWNDGDQRISVYPLDKPHI